MHKSDLLSPRQASGIENLINAFALGKVTIYASSLAHSSSYLRERHCIFVYYLVLKEAEQKK